MKLSDFSANAYKKTSSSDELSERKITVFKPQTFIKTTEPSYENSLANSDIPQRHSPEARSTETPAEVALREGGLLKVPALPRDVDGRENVYRRVAKFLVLIGTDEAARILPHLTPEQTEKIVPELASIRTVEKEEAEEILKEFEGLIKRAREDGGVDTARNILEKAFGTEKAELLMDKAVPFKNGKPFDYLAEADVEKISALLKDESAAVRALVCSHLAPKKAAGFIQQLPEIEKKEVILRLAKLKEMSPEIVAKVDEAMQKKVNTLVTEKSNSIDGKNILAQILKRMDSGNEEKIINQLAESNPELGNEIRDRLFTMEDITYANDRYLQDKLLKMSDIDIAYLIQKKSDNVKNKILGNVSDDKRKSVLLFIQEQKMLEPVKIEQITNQFFSMLRRDWEDGKLIIQRDDGEIYV